MFATAAEAAESPKFGQEHLAPALACTVVGYRYTGAAKLATLGGPKEQITTAILAYRNSGETDEDVQIAAEQATEYALTHSKAESERMAEEKFTACLKEKNLPVDLEVAPQCWRGVRRVDDIIEERRKGISKETMLRRADAIGARNEAQGKAVRILVEKVYGWDRKLEELSFGQLIGCVRAR
jgi:hypothetical protein